MSLGSWDVRVLGLSVNGESWDFFTFSFGGGVQGNGFNLFFVICLSLLISFVLFSLEAPCLGFFLLVEGEATKHDRVYIVEQ